MPAEPRVETDVSLSPPLRIGPKECARGHLIAARTRATIQTIDRLVRQQQHIFEYSFAGDCVLRIACREARTSRALQDGSKVRPGDRIIELHLWNDHLDLSSDDEPGLEPILRFRRKLVDSLCELATLAEIAPSLSRTAAFCARMTLRGRPAKMAHVAAEFGFEVLVAREEAGISGILWRSLEKIWLVALAWTYNPRSLSRRGSGHYRAELWISRAALVKRYGLNIPARGTAGGFTRSPRDGRFR